MADYEKITLDGVVSKIRQLVPGMPFDAKGKCFLWLVLDNEELPDEHWYILCSEAPLYPLLSTGSQVFGGASFRKDEETDREELDVTAVEKTAAKMIDDLYKRKERQLATVRLRNGISKLRVLTVNLKNGTSELRVLAVGTYESLKEMLNEAEGTIAFYGLVEVCKNPSHQIRSKAQKEYLISRSLMKPDGGIHQSIRNVVLSAIEGEGLGLILVNPIAPED